jgi:hypothetical protein
VVGDGLQRADPVEQLVRGVAGQHGLEGAESIAGVGAAGDRADAVTGARQRGPGGDEFLCGSERRPPGGLELLARLVELLGEHLEIVRTGGDEVRRLAGAGGLWFGGGGKRDDGQPARGDQGDQGPAAGEEGAVGRAERTRHDGGSSFLPRPPAELADGFGQEDARRPAARSAVGRFTPVVHGSPVHEPARFAGGWFGGVRTVVTRAVTERPGRTRGTLGSLSGRDKPIGRIRPGNRPRLASRSRK